MIFKISSHKWLQNTIFILFLATLLAGGIWAYETLSPPAHEAKISFTLGIDKTLPASYKKDLLKERLDLLTSNEVLKPVLALWPLTHREEKQFIDFIKNHLQIIQNQQALNLFVIHKKPSSAKELAQMIVSVFSEQLEKVRQSKQTEFSEALAFVDKKIKELINHHPNVDSELIKDFDENALATSLSKNQLSLLEKQQLIKRYIDTYIDLVRLEAIMRFIRSKQAHDESYLDIPEIAQDSDLRTLIRSVNILRLKIEQAKQKFDSSIQNLKAMEFEYNALKKQIDIEVNGLIRQFSNQIEINKGIIEKIGELIGRNILNAYSKFGFKEAIEPQKLSAFLQFRAKLQYYFTQREALESKYYVMSRDTEPIIVLHPAENIKGPYLAPYKKYIFVTLLAFFLLSLVLAFTIRFFAFQDMPIASEKEAEHLTKMSSFDDERGGAPRLINEKQILRRLLSNVIKKIAFFGSSAEQEIARLLLSYRETGKKALMIDLSGKELGKYIGKYLGLTDVLLNRASLQEALYRDSKLGVDILSKGQTFEGELKREDLTRFPLLLHHLEKYYDAIFISVSEEPFIFLNDFLDDKTDIVVCHAFKGTQESQLWITTLQLCGFKDIFILKNNE